MRPQTAAEQPKYFFSPHTAWEWGGSAELSSLNLITESWDWRQSHRDTQSNDAVRRDWHESSTKRPVLSSYTSSQLYTFLAHVDKLSACAIVLIVKTLWPVIPHAAPAPPARNDDVIDSELDLQHRSRSFPFECGCGFILCFCFNESAYSTHSSLQSLVEICNDVFFVLDAYGQADEIVVNPKLLPLLFHHWRVCHDRPAKEDTFHSAHCHPNAKFLGRKLFVSIAFHDCKTHITVSRTYGCSARLSYPPRLSANVNNWKKRTTPFTSHIPNVL